MTNSPTWATPISTSWLMAYANRGIFVSRRGSLGGSRRQPEWLGTRVDREQPRRALPEDHERYFRIAGFQLRRRTGHQRNGRRRFARYRRHRLIWNTPSPGLETERQARFRSST